LSWGERAYAEGLGDNPTPALPDDQQSLIAALEATGKPVIVVTIAGRPLGLGPASDASALLMAYLPGTEGGAAVADVLFGDVNPSGYLPVTWPSAAPENAGDTTAPARQRLETSPSSSISCPAPISALARRTTRATRSVSPLLYHLRHAHPVRVELRRIAGDGDVHGREYGESCRDYRRTHLRAPAGERHPRALRSGSSASPG
jgi:hypothetical protein